MNKIKECLGWLAGERLQPIPAGYLPTTNQFIAVQPTAAPPPRAAALQDMREVAIGPFSALQHIELSNIAYKGGSALLSGYLKAAGWNIRASDTHHIPAVGQMIFALNHASNWDSVIVTLALAQLSHLCKTNPLSFAAKQELFKIPGLAWALTMMEQIPINRAAHDAAALEVFFGKVKEKLEQGGSVGFFPEGSRTLDGNLHRLKIGMFQSATREWVDGYPAGDIQIVPVGIIGLAGQEPDWATVQCCGRDVEVKFAAPKTIDQLVAEFKQKSVAALKERFAQWQESEEGDVLGLLQQLLSANDLHTLLKENLVSADGAKQKVAQKILLRWLAQDFAEILAQTSGQNYVDCYSKKSGVVTHHNKSD